MTKQKGYQIQTAALAIALFAAAVVAQEFAAQDVVHVYATSSLTQFYRSTLDGKDGMAATYFPREGRVNFPLPGATKTLKITLGETPGGLISGVRVCIERGLLVTRCAAGSALVSNISLDQAELSKLRPSRDLPLFLVHCAFFVLATAFFYAFCYALLQPAFAWWTPDAALVFLAAACERIVFFRFFEPGGVSDSDLFLRYFQFHIFGIPGIRGVVYPAFTTLFSGHNFPLFTVQFLFGSLGAVMVLMMVRSFKRPSRWDMVWALVAASLPVLVAMEGLILSESLSLFLMLAVLLAFRWLQKDRASLTSLAGLGAACALLQNTKPQFSFVPLLLAAAIAFPWRQAPKRLIIFGAPVLGLYLFAGALDYSRGNFLGVSSTLGYSLFDHAQQGIDCRESSSDPHIQYYCEARQALGPNGDPYGYTAWVIFPAMHRLGEPFHVVTERYAALSFHLIAQHPRLYANTVMQSFWTFWTGEIPMVSNLLARSNHPVIQKIANIVVPIERWIRDAIVLLFFLAIVAAIVLGIRPDRDAFLFCALMVSIVLISSILQALVESGRENPRFEIPTEPLLTMTIVYVATRLMRIIGMH